MHCMGYLSPTHIDTAGIDRFKGRLIATVFSSFIRLMLGLDRRVYRASLYSTIGDAVVGLRPTYHLTQWWHRRG